MNVTVKERILYNNIILYNTLFIYFGIEGTWTDAQPMRRNEVRRGQRVSYNKFYIFLLK